MGLNFLALPEQRSRRWMRLVVTPDLILQVLKVPQQGVVVDGVRIKATKDAIPESAKAVRCGITDRGDVQMLIEDTSFSEVIEGAAILQLSPWYSNEEAT